MGRDYFTVESPKEKGFCLAWKIETHCPPPQHSAHGAPPLWVGPSSVLLHKADCSSSVCISVRLYKEVLSFCFCSLALHYSLHAYLLNRTVSFLKEEVMLHPPIPAPPMVPGTYKPNKRL